MPGESDTSPRLTLSINEASGEAHAPEASDYFDIQFKALCAPAAVLTLEDPSESVMFTSGQTSTEKQASIWPSNLPKPGEVVRGKGCGDWGVAVCGCKAKAVPSHCNRLDCPLCADHLRARRARRILARLDAGRNGRPVVYTVFTVPPEDRERAADVKTWNKWRRKIWKWMKENLLAQFAVERTDPCGDDRVKWHPHLNFLWVQRAGTRAFISPKKLEELKLAWQEIIGAYRAVNVYTKYSSEEKQIRHWASYLGRTWPEWRKSVPRHVTMRWLGKYPKIEPVEGDGSCNECGEYVEILRVRDRGQADLYVHNGAEFCRAELRRRRREHIGPTSHDWGRK